MELTAQIVISARLAVAGGERVRQIARDHDIPYGTLKAAVSGRTWRHLDAQAPPVPASTYGERSARLTAAQVLRARAAVREGAQIRALAREADVGEEPMRLAVRGITWRHLDAQEPPVPCQPKPMTSPATLTEAKVARARRDYREGKATLAALARRYRVSPSAIAAAVHGTTWAHLTEPAVPVRQTGGPQADPQTIAQVRRSVANGVPVGVAAQAADISRVTAWRYLNQNQ